MNNNDNLNRNNNDNNKKKLNSISSYSQNNLEKKEIGYSLGNNNKNDEEDRIYNEYYDKIYSLNQFDNIIKNNYFKKTNTRIRQCE